MRRVRPYRFVPQTSDPADPIGRALCGSGTPPPEPLFCVPRAPFAIRLKRTAHKLPVTGVRTPGVALIITNECPAVGLYPAVHPNFPLGRA